MSTSPDRLALRGPGRPLSWGEGALAAFMVATATGVILALPYDVRDAWGSVATMLLANPGAEWFRNLHFWSAQALVVLTGLHLWDTLRRRLELRLRPGSWIRIVLALPGLALLMLTGFLLRGDPDANQALRILTSFVPDPAFFGSLESVYLHHAATLTLLLLLVTVEHGRVLWPLGRALGLVLGGVSLVSLVLSPGLHDALDPIVKGPWYFVGLQETLHQASWPGGVLLLGAVLLGVMLALRWMDADRAARARWLLAAFLGLYGVLTVVGWSFRGEDWRWTAPWAPGSPSILIGWVFRSLDVSPQRLRSTPLPRVLGRPEGCVFCHAGGEGLEKSHRGIGCASCHLGSPFSLDPTVAHRGMARVPGNLAVAPRTCGTTSCHPSIVPRVKGSLMNTMAGVVAVDREVFGDPPGPPAVQDLGTSGADGHLRQLCASCHVGAAKAEPGPITEESRGGGCSGCHLSYPPEARKALLTRPGVLPAPVHSTLSLEVQCFGCHSRSGRISLNYDGWHEGGPPGPERRLEDGRVVFRGTPDVHSSKGMGCTDCHTALEAMGDGADHRRKTEATRVECEDCHGRVLVAGRLEGEAERIRSVRPALQPTRPPLATVRGDVLLNTYVDPLGEAHLVRKSDDRVLPLRPPAPACRDQAHRRLSCAACHESWAPRCDSCHTRFEPQGRGFDLLAEREVRGEWVEEGSVGQAAPPTLGVWIRGPRPQVEPFVPGMVATLESPGRAPIFRRLYALTFPHTITRRGRSCRSCHLDPTALGYGAGRLSLEGERWRYTPDHPPAPQDGLPTDAWIGFLGSRQGMVSTRPDVRPFTVEEQQRILTVGACLTCHAEESAVMRAALHDFARTLARVPKSCVRPRWAEHGGTSRRAEALP